MKNLRRNRSTNSITRFFASALLIYTILLAPMSALARTTAANAPLQTAETATGGINSPFALNYITAAATYISDLFAAPAPTEATASAQTPPQDETTDKSVPRTAGKAIGLQKIQNITQIKTTEPIFLVAGTCSLGNAVTPIEVESSGGSPIAAYASLTAGFAAINTGTHTGTITIDVCGNSAEGTGTAVLNASGAGSASYTSILMSPVGVWTISGATTAGNPLINLNGADNVTIDGLNAGGNSLTISNTTASGTAGTSTIRFINDATSNKVTNTTILGSSTGTAAQTGSASSPAAATILISGSTGATGNDNNQITNNNIGEAGVNLPVVAISSAGQSVSITNDTVTITGNNIFNFYGASGANGVAVGSNSSAFTISNNKFYQTASRSGLASASYWEAVFISTASGGGYTVNSNTIGFASSAGTGMLTNSGGRLVGIDLTAVAASPVSDIQGNTINGINWTTASGAATAGAAPINGIIVKAGGVNIGTTSGNTIGATSGTGSSTSNIFVTSTSTGTGIWGIYVTSANNATISNNSMGAIAASGTAAVGFTITGIEVAGAGSHTVTSNTIGNSTANNIAAGVSGTTTAATNVIGISSSATGTTVSLGNTSGTGNTIQNTSSFGSSTSSLFYGVRNTGAAGTVNMNFNTFTANTLAGGGSAAATIYYANILNSGAATTAININNNTVNSATISTVTFAGTSGFIISISSGASSAVSIQNNAMTGFTFTGATGGTGSFLGITHQGNAGSENVSNNSFNNLTLKTSGAIILIQLNNTTNTVTVSGNAIGTQLTRTVSSGNSLIGAFNAGGSSPFVTAGTHTISNNNFSNITSTTTSTATTGVVGIIWQPGASATSAPTVNITGNTISNHSNSSTSPATGIIADFSANLTISGNLISDLSTAGATAIGIQSTVLGATSNVFKNKIYNLSTTTSTTGVATGISVVSGSSATTTTYNIYNNLIGNLLAPSSSGTNQVVGISIAGPAATNSHNIYYNTVYLNASGGTNFGSSAVSASSTPTVTLRNNVLVNLSTPTGTGATVAYRRSSTTLTTYGITSNNNDFYAGTPGASRLIFNDGTNSDPTIAAYKTRVSTRDTASFTENPTFLGTTGANANFLHINTAIATQIESGGANIPTFTDDYDGDTRSATTPDVGADEFTGTAIDLSAPIINYTNLANTASVTSRAFLNVTVTDATGVNTTSGTRPRVYYKKSGNANTFNDNTSGTDGWKYAEANGTGGSPFDFTIDYSILFGGSGVISGDVIQYFVVAQDTVSPTPNVGIKDGVFTATPASVALTSAAFPISGTINSYAISPAISGTKTVCASGCNYSTLTGAGGVFADINLKTLTNDVEIQITGNLSTGEDGTNALNSLTVEPAGSLFKVKIYPTGSARTITGTNSGGFIRLNAADRVTIDGSIDGAGTDRSLTITQTNAGTSSAVIWLQTGGADGATGNAVKNVNVVGNSNTTTLVGIGSGSNTVSVSSLGTGNNSNTIQNNNISKTQYGIYSQGASAGAKNTGNVITQNLVNTASPNNVQFCAVMVGFEDGIQISNNTISGLTTTNDLTAIAVGVTPTSISTSTTTGNEVTNATISGNNVGSVVSTSATGFSAFGIAVASAATGTTNITNNFVSGVTAPATSGDLAAGIYVGGTTGTGAVNVRFNSVSMTGTRGAATFPSYALAIATGDPKIDVRNNILFNTQTSSGAGKMYAIGVGSSTFTNLTSDYNDLFVTGASGFVGQTGGIGTGGTDRLNIAAWQTGVGATKDTHSVPSNPQFASLTDLHITHTPLNPSPVENKGQFVSGITTDYDGDTRDGSTPEIGADEVITAQFDTATYSVAENVSGGVATITVSRTSGSASAADITYATSNGTATVGTCGTGGADYQSASGTRSFAVGETSKTFDVTICDEGLFEANETINLTLSNPTGTTLLGIQSTAVLTITNDDTAPTISIGNAAVGEGGGNAVFTVTQSASSSVDTTFNYSTADGTAIAGSDYTGASNSAGTITAGSTTTTVSIPITQDNLVEADETFTVTLANPVNATIAAATGTATITDDDNAPVAQDVTTTATAGTAKTITLTATDADSQALTFSIVGAPLHGTLGSISAPVCAGTICTATVDYTAAPTTYSGADGFTYKANDGVNDSNTATVNITVTAATPLINVTGTIAPFADTIVGFNSAEQSYTVSGGNLTDNLVVTSPSTDFQISTVSGSGFGSSVTLTPTGGTVAPTTIYVRFTPQSAGAKSGDISHTSTGAAAQTVAVSGRGIQPGSLQLSSAAFSTSETNADHTFNIPVTRGVGADGAVSVNYSVTDGSATIADSDYTIVSANGTLNWTDGDAADKNIVITVKGDTVFEGDETVNIAISGVAGGATLGTPSSAVLTITNDDANDITFNADGNLPAGTYNNITINAPAIVTMTGSVTANGNVVVNGGATLLFGTDILSGAGAFTAENGSTISLGDPNGITSSPTLSGNVQVTGIRDYKTGVSVIYNGSVNQTVGNGLPATIANLTIANTGGAGNNTVSGNPGQIVSGLLKVESGVYQSASDYNDVEIDAGATWDAGAGETITVSGNWTNNGTFAPHGSNVVFDGTGLQTIGGASATTFSNLTINKATGTAMLASDVLASALFVSAGTFNQGAAGTVTAGAVTVSAGASWLNYGTGDLNLGGSVSNAGTIAFDTNGAGCGSDDILIRSTVSGAQRTWLGSGAFTMSDVNVQDQSGAAIITVNSGTNAGNNGLNWLFVATCTGGSYTWNGGLAGDWNVGANWTPTRVAPNASDILIIDGSAASAPVISNVPTQTIAALRVINNAQTELRAFSADTTLTVSGSTGTDLIIPAGSLLKLGGSNALTVSIASGSHSDIAGTFILDGGAHRLIGNASGAINFQFDSICTTSGTFTGNPFGDGGAGNGANDSATFQSGATYFHNGGESPFGSTSANVASFQTGSTAVWLTTAGFDASGRSYSNLEIGGTNTAVNLTAGGAGNFAFDNLTVNSTASLDSSFTFNGSGTNSVVIGGNISSAGIGTASNASDVNITAGSGGIALTKPGTQTFGGGNGRTVTFNSDATVAAGTTLALTRNLIIAPDSSVLTINGNITAGAGGYVVGNLRKNFAAAGVKTFEVGTGNGYSPVDVNVTGGTGDFTARAEQGKLPAIIGGRALSRYWTLSGTGLVADITFHYQDPLDIPAGATEASFLLYKSEGVLTQVPASLDTLNNKVTATGVSSFSDWTLAEPSAVSTGTIQFSQPVYSVGENGTSVNIDVTRTGGSGGAASVNYATSGGTATGGTDYADASGTFNWADGDSSVRTITVLINDDGIYESAEDFTASLSGAVGATLGSPTLTTVTINDNDSQPTVSIDDVTQAEGDAGTTVYNFTVTRTGATELGTVVNFHTSDGTASSGTDYEQISSSSVTFSPSDTSKQISVNVSGDVTFENNETFAVELDSATNAAITDGGGTGTITNDDAAPTLSVSDFTFTGVDSIAVGGFTVTLAGATDLPVTVHYATSDGTAVAGQDYTSTSGTLTFNPGETVLTIPVTILADTAQEDTETFLIDLDTPVNATISDAQGVGTIPNDDAPPTFAVDDVTAAEGSGGATDFTFTVTRTGSTDLSSTVGFTTQNGTATGGAGCGGSVDFVSQTSSVTFLAAESTKQIVVSVCGDIIVEANESFTVHLTGTSNGAITDADGAGTITDDDTPGAIVYVDDDWSLLPIGTDPDGAGPATVVGYDAFATIQGGADGVATGGTINVAAGAYIENVVIAKPLTLTGAGAGSVTLRPAISGPNPCAGASICPGASSMILVQANNVAISGLTLDGDNPALTSGVVRGGADLDARNGIITNHTLGTYTNLTVHHTTIKNIYLRGFYNSTGGAFSCHHNIFDNIQGEGASIAAFNFGGAGAFDSNTVSNANDAIASNHSRGTQFTNNIVTTSASGIHTDNAGDQAGSLADTISGNTVTNSQLNGFGIWIFVSNKTVNVLNNTVTNVDVGLSAAGMNLGITALARNVGETKTAIKPPQSFNLSEADSAFQLKLDELNASSLVAPSAAIFTGNTVDGQNKANSTGVYFTTSQFGFGSANTRATFTSNTVVNNVDGFYLEADSGFTLDVDASFNRIVNNTGSEVTGAGGGTLNALMENNWWGCNAGLNNAGCGVISGSGIDFAPWLVLGVSASPNPIAPGETSSVTADLTRNSDNVVPSIVDFVPSTGVAFASTQGTVAPPNGTLNSGQANSTFTSTAAASGSASATVDNQTVNTAINVTLPVFTIDDVTHLEGASGTTSYVFTVTKTGATAFNSSVSFQTQDGSAAVGSDYQSNSGTLNFGPTETTKQFTVLVVGDAIFETDETFNVNLSGAAGATIGDASGTGAITNDDVLPVLSINDVSMSEGDSGTTTFTFTVTKTGDSQSGSQVSYATAAGGANPATGGATCSGSVDYEAASGTLNFSASDTQKQITVNVCGDAGFESNETFVINLSGASGASVSDGQGSGTILNDDGSVDINVSLPSGLTPLANTTFLIPVTVSDTTGKGALSYDFQFSYDQSKIAPEAIPYDTSGTLSSGFTVTPNVVSPGTLQISGFSATPLTGAGTLIYLKFNVLATPPSCSAFSFLNFTFNEGQPNAVLTGAGGMCVKTGNISGRVTYATSPSLKTVAGVTVGGSGVPNVSTTTDSGGLYNLSGFGAGAYTVTPSKTGDIDPMTLSSLDASYIARYVVGIMGLDTNQRIAADVSNNGTITSFDAALVAQYIVGLTQNQPNFSGTWRFIQPSKSYPNVWVDYTLQDYEGLVMGDVTGNWMSAGMRPDFEGESLSPDAVLVSLTDSAMTSDNEIIVPVKISDVTNRGVYGFDFEVRFDGTVMNFAEGNTTALTQTEEENSAQTKPVDILSMSSAIETSGTLSQNYSIAVNEVSKGVLRITGYGVNPLEGAGELLRLKFRVRKGIGSMKSKISWSAAGLNEGSIPVTATGATLLIGQRGKKD